jgi:hypothetical protein
MKLRTLSRPAPRWRSALGRAAALGALCLTGAAGVRAADHTDPSQGTEDKTRRDAQITDFYLWVRRGETADADRVVMALTVNPFIAPLSKGQRRQGFRFPSDVDYEFHFDQHSSVSSGEDPAFDAAFGGRVANPAGIAPDITIRVTFKRAGGRSLPQLQVTAGDLELQQQLQDDIRVFADYRADAFNFAPFRDRNAAAIVLEVDRELLLRGDADTTLLAWATTEFEDEDGTFREHAGRALRSQGGEFVAIGLNGLAPNLHETRIDTFYDGTPAAPLNETPECDATLAPTAPNHCGFSSAPDVAILDTASPDGFPNGRRLFDDVTALLAEPALAPFDDDRIFELEQLICPAPGSLTGFDPPPFAPFIPTRPCDQYVDVSASEFPGLVPAGASEDSWPYLGSPHLK